MSLPVTAWKAWSVRGKEVGVFGGGTHLHHGEMLTTVVCLKESISRPTLH